MPLCLYRVATWRHGFRLSQRGWIGLSLIVFALIMLAIGLLLLFSGMHGSSTLAELAPAWLLSMCTALVLELLLAMLLLLHPRAGLSPLQRSGLRVLLGSSALLLSLAAVPALLQGTSANLPPASSPQTMRAGQEILQQRGLPLYSATFDSVFDISSYSDGQISCSLLTWKFLTIGADNPLIWYEGQARELGYSYRYARYPGQRRSNSLLCICGPDFFFTGSESWSNGYSFQLYYDLSAVPADMYAQFLGSRVEFAPAGTTRIKASAGSPAGR